MNAGPAQLPIPGLLWGQYPERRPEGTGLLARWADSLAHRAPRHSGFLRAVESLQPAMLRLSSQQCSAEARTLRRRLGRRGMTDELQAVAFALFSELSRRQTGQRPYPVQLLAARAMLGRNLVEMATGEGKTLAAALAAATAALARVPVHVVTANEYLARRDAEALGPVFAALGLQVGVVTHELGADARRRAYRCDITYCTAKELVFDYLRDRLSRRGIEGEVQGGSQGELRRRAHRLATGEAAGTLLRGLCMAIVDEVDRSSCRAPRITAASASITRARSSSRAASFRARTWSSIRRRTQWSSPPAGARRPSRKRRKATRCGGSSAFAKRPCAWRSRRCICSTATGITWCAAARCTSSTTPAGASPRAARGRAGCTS
jgi:hypothetical protein